MITLKFKDGSSMQFPKGTLVGDILAKAFKNDQASTLAVELNGKVLDVHMPIEESGEFKILKFSDPKGADTLRHTSSHVLALAVKRLFPGVKITIGPAVEDGFYYDFDNITLKEEDFPRIEQEMSKIIKEKLPISRRVVSRDEALKIFHDEPYKVELINDLPKDETITTYKLGEFEDLCRGPHIANTKQIGAIKVLKLAGAYWRGDSTKAVLTRVYGTSFPDKKMLTEYLNRLEEAKKRDHRKIGRELDLFEIDDDIGPGLVLWLPKGNIIKEELENWAKETEEEWGYKRVTTPLITKENVFLTSEHLPHYADFMFSPMEVEGAKYYIKPMNCPFHHKVFAARKRSYRELPLRLAEYGWCHRYEQSGAITGLMRVRGMQMNDAHIYCTREQAVDEFIDVIKLHEYYYKILGITEYSMELALRDPASNKYHGDEHMWKDAEALMMEAMKKSGVKYTIVNGGAAFYGPKIDFQVKSVIGREFTASTNQIDLFMGKKFNLQYADSDGTLKTPVVIHRAPLGTHERFIGFLIEHFAGKFPLWLNPVQVKLLPLTDRNMDYVKSVAARMKASGLRVEIDERSESAGKKVRDAQLERVNYILVVGDKEQAEGSVNVRTRAGEVKGTVPVDALISQLVEEIKTKSLG